MSRYIRFTNEQKEQAHNADIAEFLASQGETLKRVGSQYEWRDGADKVLIRGNLWFSYYEQQGGDAVGFVKKYFDKSYAEAVTMLLGGGAAQAISTAQTERDKAPKPEFVLPKKNDNMRRAFAYLLMQRGIDRDIICEFARRGLIYESAEHHNAVFVGCDKDGVPRHAHMRGTGSSSTFKCSVPGSEPEYSFNWRGMSNRLYLFEAPIDMMSFISMHKDNWYEHNYAAACSVADRVLFQFLNDRPDINEVFLCLDNDEAGQSAERRISDKLFVTRGINTSILVPKHKDWNEDLTNTDSDECRELQFS